MNGSSPSLAQAPLNFEISDEGDLEITRNEEPGEVGMGDGAWGLATLDGGLTPGVGVSNVLLASSGVSAAAPLAVVGGTATPDLPGLPPSTPDTSTPDVPGPNLPGGSVPVPNAPTPVGTIGGIAIDLGNQSAVTTVSAGIGGGGAAANVSVAGGEASLTVDLSSPSTLAGLAGATSINASVTTDLNSGVASTSEVALATPILAAGAGVGADVSASGINAGASLAAETPTALAALAPVIGSTQTLASATVDTSLNGGGAVLGGSADVGGLAGASASLGVSDGVNLALAVDASTTLAPVTAITAPVQDLSGDATVAVATLTAGVTDSGLAAGIAVDPALNLSSALTPPPASATSPSPLDVAVVEPVLAPLTPVIAPVVEVAAPVIAPVVTTALSPEAPTVATPGALTDTLKPGGLGSGVGGLLGRRH